MEAKSSRSASANRSVPGVEGTRDEPAAGERPVPESTSNATLLERVLSRANLKRALKQVRSNRGAPGIDGMSVDALPGYLKEHWPEIRAQLVAGSYRPQPVRRVEIPKPDGRKRPLGIPTVLDRFIQQAIRSGSRRAMGTPLPPAQLRFSPAALGASGRAAVAGGYPKRQALGGRP
jgi:hypothetical protein